MADLSYVRLPKNVSEDELRLQCKRLRELRLLSLQTDRGSWISRYEDEVNQPLSFFLDRLRPAGVEHFVGLFPSHTIAHSDVLTATQYEAFLVFLKLDLNEQVENPLKEYSMEAVYVRPDQRGKGVCTRMIQESVKWASEDLHQTNTKEAVVHTTVAEGNVSAQRLYSKLGFEAASRKVEKDKVGVDREVIKMRLRLFR